MMNRPSLVFIAAGLALVPSSLVVSFTCPQPTLRRVTTFYRSSRTTFLSAKKQDEDEEEDTRSGMAEAFRELDALESLGDDSTTKKPKIKDDRQGFKEVKVEPLAVEKASPEAEVEIYKKMFKEGEQDTDELYSDVLSEMGGTPPKPTSTEEESSEEPPVLERTQEDLEKFMNQALEEALEEARAKTPEELASGAENALDDEEMMKEIEQVFEKANAELMSSIEDIRKEQAALAKESAERNAKMAVDEMADNAQRLEQAEASMKRMLKKVEDETLEVEKAVEDLKAAQAELSSDPISKLREGGFIKQGALVGSILFFVRAVVEGVQMAGPGGDTHAIPALVQGAIALACAAYYLLF